MSDNPRPLEKVVIEKPNSTRGRQPTFAWLAVSELYVDDTYQRDIGQNGLANVQQIGANFRWSCFSPLVVNRRGKNSYVIIDGQHRATAAKSIGLSTVPCFIIECDRTEEARAFAAINGNITQLKGLQVYFAELAAGDETAKILQRVCKAASVIVPRKSCPLTPGVTLAIGALKRNVKNHGPEILELALKIVTQTGDGNPGMLREGVIAGGCDVFAFNPSWRGEKVLTAVAKKGGIPKLYQQALELAATPDFNMRTGYEQALTTRLFEELGSGTETEKISSGNGLAPPQKANAETVIAYLETQDVFAIRLRAGIYSHDGKTTCSLVDLVELANQIRKKQALPPFITGRAK